MKIAVYCEPLCVATSANPGRGMLKELIGIRNQDFFLLITRSDYTKDYYLNSFFESIREYKNWEVRRLEPSRRIVNIKALFRNKRYCKIDLDADVYLNMDCDYLGSAARPLIVTLADLSVFKGVNASTYSRKINLWTRRFILDTGIRFSDRIAAISHSTKNDLSDFYPGLDINKVSVIHNGIANEWFEGDLNGIKQPYYVWWGFISPRKNIDGLLYGYREAWKKSGFSERFSSLKIIFSNRTVPNELMVLSKELGLDSKLHFIPSLNLSDLIKTVTESQGLIFPSNTEGFGVPVIEALACGRPVIGSSIPAITEVGGGFISYCDPASPSSIANQIFSLEAARGDIDSPDMRMDRREYARRFTLANAAQNYSQLIDRTASGL